MQEFLMLVALLLGIAFLQKGAEFILDKYKLENHKPVLHMACIVTSYFLVGRYAYIHLLEELIALIGFTF